MLVTLNFLSYYEWMADDLPVFENLMPFNIKHMIINVTDRIFNRTQRVPIIALSFYSQHRENTRQNDDFIVLFRTLPKICSMLMVEYDSRW